MTELYKIQIVNKLVQLLQFFLIPIFQVWKSAMNITSNESIKKI